MKSADGATEPVWGKGVDVPRILSLKSDHAIDTDLCVVGAGISGLTIAYLAALEGRSVVVVDEGSPNTRIF